MTIGPHGQVPHPTDKRPTVVQLDEPRQNTPFLTLAQSRPQPHLAASAAPPTPDLYLNLRPSDHSKR